VTERIALCGGTFDPVHRAHLDAPLSVASQLGWTRIVFIPARQQPFKLNRQTSSAFHRHAMLVLATEERNDVDVSIFEVERETVSYTVDTLEHFRAEFPDATLDWVIGDDNLALLTKWRSIDRIFELANFVVLAREEGSDLPSELESRRRDAASRGAAGAIVFASNRVMPISSTSIRLQVSKGEAFEELVHPRVAHYIRKHRLYTGANH
jgi:nicotinate-nucleotide adenylyltransferase